MYDVDLVSTLLGVAFDSGRGWGAELSDIRIDPMMPRAQSDPSSKGDLWAMCADVQRAFGVLTLAEARAVWLMRVVGLTQVAAGEVLGVHRTSVMRLAEWGVDRMTRWLNGDRDCAHNWRAELPVSSNRVGAAPRV